VKQIGKHPEIALTDARVATVALQSQANTPPATDETTTKRLKEIHDSFFTRLLVG
jgi:hypothetical protein